MIVLGAFGHNEEQYLLLEAKALHSHNSAPSRPTSLDFCAWQHVRHVIAVTRGKGYFATRSGYYSNSTSTSSLHLIRLFISGDVNLNPGPGKCHICLKTIARNHRVLNCNDCNNRFHIKCGRVGPKEYKSYQLKDWICTACLLLNLPFTNNVNLDDSLQTEQHVEIASDAKNCDLNNLLEPYVNKQCIIGNLNINSIIGNLNINSLPSKFIEIQEWIELFDILSIQETKIDSTFPDLQFFIQGYTTYRRDRKKGGGGILLYIRNSIPSYLIKTKRADVEAILVDIEISQQHFSLVYKPPSVNNATFNKDMSILLESAISNRPNIICIGDLACVASV